jgi:hypothetical protein
LKHKNPYRINDPQNLFEVGENSSHPELNDKKRVWSFRGYTFHSATELERYFNNEGLDPRRYWMKPTVVESDDGNYIKIFVVERAPAEERHMMRSLAR